MSSTLRTFRCIAGLLAAALSACGGGGSGLGLGTQTLTVSFSYPDTHVNLRASLRTAPILTGLDGHNPQCTQTGGTLPPGVSLDSSSCVLAGHPTAAGTFGLNVQLTADGVQGSIQTVAEIFVDDPTPIVVAPNGGAAPIVLTLQYAQAGPATPIVALDGGHYTALPGDVVRFAVTGGSLPSGVLLDATTGTLAGTPMGFGMYAAQIGATLTRQGIDYVSQPIPVSITVLSTALSINYSGTCLVAVATPLTCGLRADLTAVPPGVALHFTSPDLPAGLSIDASTGVISGTLYAVEQIGVSVEVQGVFPDGSVLTTTSGAFIRTAGPYPQYGPNSSDFGIGSDYGPQRSVNVGYDYTIQVTPGAPFAVEVNPSGQPGDTSFYELLPYDATTPLPNWVSIDVASGRLSGVPPPGTAPMSWTVQVTTGRAGHTYVTAVRWLALFQ